MNKIQKDAFSGSTVILLAVAVCVGLISGCDSTTQKTNREVGSVALTIDFGSEKESIETDVVCSPQTTVLEVLERAQNMDELKFTHRGSGETAFVTAIGGLENEGAAGKNWIYRVNGETGDRSAGVYQLAPGDRVSWSFGTPPKDLFDE